MAASWSLELCHVSMAFLCSQPGHGGAHQSGRGNEGVNEESGCRGASRACLKEKQPPPAPGGMGAPRPCMQGHRKAELGV